MDIARDIVSLRGTVKQLWKRQGRVALVPTMGALHDGHMVLVKAAQKLADGVVLSIFVNPTQFGKGEDFESYPRSEADDVALCEKHGVNAVYIPTPEVMYPQGFTTELRVGGPSQGLCGASRPGHFNGVALVVVKLLMQVMPDVAVFGKKDYQQLQVIRRVVQDLDIDVKIEGVETSRDSDGVARSSRNAYLTAAERKVAPSLYETLLATADKVREGGNVDYIMGWAKGRLLQAGFDAVEYVALCDEQTLVPISNLDKALEQRQGMRLLAAAKLGKARLIDNVDI